MNETPQEPTGRPDEAPVDATRSPAAADAPREAAADAPTAPAPAAAAPAAADAPAPAAPAPAPAPEAAAWPARTVVAAWLAPALWVLAVAFPAAGLGLRALG
ncbi:hypothetical protein C5B94_09540, partial [Clavibacter michiganensis]